MMIARRRPVAQYIYFGACKTEIFTVFVVRPSFTFFSRVLVKNALSWNDDNVRLRFLLHLGFLRNLCAKLGQEEKKGDNFQHNDKCGNFLLVLFCDEAF